MKKRDLVYSILAGVYLSISGCKPNENKPPDSYPIIEKTISASESVQNPKIQKSPPDNKISGSLEDYINKSGTRLTMPYHETKPDQLPKFKISGFYSLWDDELGIKIEKEYQVDDKNEKNEAKLIRKRSAKKTSKMIIEHKGDSEGIAVINRDDELAFFWYDKGKIELDKKQIEELFRRSDSYWEAYFSRLEVDVKTAMPLMQQRQAVLKEKAEDKFNKAAGLIGY
jgi:hypothetical protein